MPKVVVVERRRDRAVRGRDVGARSRGAIHGPAVGSGVCSSVDRIRSLPRHAQRPARRPDHGRSVAPDPGGHGTPSGRGECPTSRGTATTCSSWSPEARDSGTVARAVRGSRRAPRHWRGGRSRRDARAGGRWRRPTSGSPSRRHTRLPARRPTAMRPWMEALLMPARAADSSARRSGGAMSRARDAGGGAAPAWRSSRARGLAEKIQCHEKWTSGPSVLSSGLSFPCPRCIPPPVRPRRHAC